MSCSSSPSAGEVPKHGFGHHSFHSNWKAYRASDVPAWQQPSLCSSMPEIDKESCLSCMFLTYSICNGTFCSASALLLNKTTGTSAHEKIGTIVHYARLLPSRPRWCLNIVNWPNAKRMCLMPLLITFSQCLHLWQAKKREACSPNKTRIPSNKAVEWLCLRQQFWKLITRDELKALVITWQTMFGTWHNNCLTRDEKKTFTNRIWFDCFSKPCCKLGTDLIRKTQLIANMLMLKRWYLCVRKCIKCGTCVAKYALIHTQSEFQLELFSNGHWSRHVASDRVTSLVYRK